jgi:hypothetical protein
MSSFGGEVKPSVPCCSFAVCKSYLRFTWKSELQIKLAAHFSPNSILHYQRSFMSLDVERLWKWRIVYLQLTLCNRVKNCELYTKFLELPKPSGYWVGPRDRLEPAKNNNFLSECPKWLWSSTFSLLFVPRVKNCELYTKFIELLKRGNVHISKAISWLPARINGSLNTVSPPAKQRRGWKCWRHTTIFHNMFFNYVKYPTLNPLKPSGYYMYHELQHRSKLPTSALWVRLCRLHVSQNSYYSPI